MVVLDASGSLLLVRTRDPGRPALGTWWELPGGGMKRGEDGTAAAVRELAEECGLEVSPTDLVPLPWRRSVRYVRRGATVLQDETVLLVSLTVSRPATHRRGLTPKEQDEVIGLAWWAPEALATATDRFWPGRLAEILPRVLAGTRVVESVEDRTPAEA